MQTKSLTTFQRKANIEFDCRWKEVHGGEHLHISKQYSNFVKLQTNKKRNATNSTYYVTQHSHYSEFTTWYISEDHKNQLRKRTDRVKTLQWLVCTFGQTAIVVSLNNGTTRRLVLTVRRLSTRKLDSTNESTLVQSCIGPWLSQRPTWKRLSLKRATTEDRCYVVATSKVTDKPQSCIQYWLEAAWCVGTWQIFSVIQPGQDQSDHKRWRSDGWVADLAQLTEASRHWPLSWHIKTEISF